MKLKTQADIEIAKLVISPPGDTLAETINELKSLRRNWQTEWEGH